MPGADLAPAADTTSAISPAPPDSSAPAPVLSADIPPAEKARLLEANRRDRQRAEDLLRKIASRELSTADAEKLRTAEDLLRAAQDAESRGEAQDAANLARKAWLLALDLSGR